MNRKIGLISSIVICYLVTVFLICLVIALFAQNIFTENLSYGVCTVLSWGWVATTCAYSCFTQKEYSAAAKIGVSIGVIYATIISIVYFTQLTTVLYKSVDEIILQAFSFTSAGSWLFNLDLLGYGLLSISTFFIGLTLQTKDKIDSALKLLLMLHGIFFVCMFVPILPLPATNQGNGGTIALICWCLFFLSICILSILHFKRLNDNSNSKESVWHTTQYVPIVAINFWKRVTAQW